MEGGIRVITLIACTGGLISQRKVNPAIVRILHLNPTWSCLLSVLVLYLEVLNLRNFQATFFWRSPTVPEDTVQKRSWRFYRVRQSIKGEIRGCAWSTDPRILLINFPRPVNSCQFRRSYVVNANVAIVDDSISITACASHSHPQRRGSLPVLRQDTFHIKIE